MFGWHDVWRFFFSFFLVMPVVTFLHEAGHLVFGKLTGGQVNVHIGSGNLLFKIGPCQIRKVYFWDGWCEYKNIETCNRWKKIMVYLGGSFFNIISMVIINLLIMNKVVPGNIFYYQFLYFSFYFVFFSLIPITHNGYPTDGKAIFNILKHGKTDKHPLG